MKTSDGSEYRRDDEGIGRPEDDLLAQADGVSGSPSGATESEGQPGSPLGPSGDALDTGVLDNTKDGALDVPGDAEDAAGTEGAGDPEGAAGTEGAVDAEGAADAEGAGDAEGAVDAESAVDAEGAVDAESAAGTEDGENAVGAEDPDEVAVGESDVDEPAASRKVRKVRRLALLRIDSDRLRASWRANTLGKTAILVVCVYGLAVGSAYFLIRQPMSTRLHRVQEQKSVLHDYVVIQRADVAIGAFKNGLMTGDQRLTVMSEVRLMAEGSGVKIMGDPDLLLAREGSGHFVEYPLRLRIRGTFHEIGEFLSLLEGSPRFTLLEEVEIRSDADSRERDSEATVLLALAAWEG